MLQVIRHMPVLSVLGFALLLHIALWFRMRRLPEGRVSPALRFWTGLGVPAGAGLLALGAAFGFTWTVDRVPPGPWVAWTRAAAIGWALIFTGLCAAILLGRAGAAFNPQRRWMLRSAAGVALGAPVAACGLGVYVARSRMEAREVEIRVPRLPAGLDGLRMAQLTDIHMGAFLGAAELARAVGMANEWRPHLALVTGDFISDRGDPLDECLRGLAGLRASDGIYGCCGNHEAYIHAETYCVRQAARLGIEILRDQQRELGFAGARLRLAGVDHQRLGRPYLAGAERLAGPDAFNVLLSHNPDTFPAAVEKGFQLTIAGHTHGGQLAAELAGTSVSVARMFTPFVHGVYQRGDARLYVSRGIGTVGVPMRLGAPPEVTLIRLRRA